MRIHSFARPPPAQSDGQEQRHTLPPLRLRPRGLAPPRHSRTCHDTGTICPLVPGVQTSRGRAQVPPAPRLSAALAVGLGPPEAELPPPDDLYSSSVSVWTTRIGTSPNRFLAFVDPSRDAAGGSQPSGPAAHGRGLSAEPPDRLVVEEELAVFHGLGREKLECRL